MTTYSINPIKFSASELMTIEKSLDLLEKHFYDKIPFRLDTDEFDRFKKVEKEIRRKISECFVMDSTYIGHKD